MKQEKLSVLQSELELMNNAASILQKTFIDCKKAGVESIENNIDSFELLSSRFARLSDIVIQKILKTISTIELDNFNSILDLLNNSEKKNIISNAEKWAEIRELRNSIVHEYIPEAIKEIYGNVFEFTPMLLKDVLHISTYCQKFK